MSVAPRVPQKMFAAASRHHAMPCLALPEMRSHLCTCKFHRSKLAAARYRTCTDLNPFRTFGVSSRVCRFKHPAGKVVSSAGEFCFLPSYSRPILAYHTQTLADGFRCAHAAELVLSDARYSPAPRLPRSNTACANSNPSKWTRFFYPLGRSFVSQLEGVDLKTNSITVSGIDLVDGTPVRVIIL